MKYLLDSHTYLWFSLNSPKLSQTALEIIENPENEILFSMASLWEISIKNTLGKLSLSTTYQSLFQELKEDNIEIMPISFWHTNALQALPFYHRDPFDRMLVAQAIVEEINLVGADPVFDLFFAKSPVSRIR
jgi:PIN domain nuclease of toxin-antitoxin system